MRERSETLYVWLILGSIFSMLAGLLCLMAGFGSGSLQLIRGHFVTGPAAITAIIGAILLLGGIGVLAFAILSGAAVGATEKRGVRRVDPHTRVLARYATNRSGESLILESDYPDPKTRFYVRMELADGSRAEFQCVREVFLQCGEGMRGESHFQGRWLGMFRPYIGGQLS